MCKKKWKQCGRKKRYRDEHSANHYRKMFEKMRGKKLDYYWCGYCKGYHLTSSESLWGTNRNLDEEAAAEDDLARIYEPEMFAAIFND